MELLFCVLPVVLFLFFLYLLDSFKLVLKNYLFFCLLWGLISAGMAYFLNSFLLEQFTVSFKTISLYVAPFIEEIVKSLFILVLIYKKRIGFMIDAAVYGFAIGTGFSLVENVFYFKEMGDYNLIVWIVRGFGTAFMHGGCTALFAVILIGGKSRNVATFTSVFFAILAAYFIHSTFNQFYIQPIFQTIGIILIFPAVFILIFRYNELQLQNWLEIEFNSEIELLNMINKGQFLSTRSGEYLASLKSRFSGEMIFDMFCYIRIYLELSIKAKRNVLLKESGFPAMIEDDLDSKFNELLYLKKQIGKVGELTLSPLIRMNYRDLWKLNTLKKN